MKYKLELDTIIAIDGLLYCVMADVYSRRLNTYIDHPLRLL